MVSHGSMKEYFKYDIFAFMFGFGGSVNGSMTYYLGIPVAYLTYIGASVTQIGSLTAILWAGFSIPQLWAAYATETKPIKKRFMASAIILSGLTWLIIGMHILFFGGRMPVFSVWLFLILFAWAVSLVGMFMPANFSLIYKITPTERLGHLIGILFAVQFLGTFVGGFAINYINNTFNEPVNYAVLFLLTFVISTGIAFLLLRINEPESEQIKAEPSFGVYLGKCLTVLKTDRLFTKFLVAKWLMSGHYVMMAFILVYLIRERGFDPLDAGWFSSLYALGLALAGFTITKISDMYGPRYMLVTSQVIAVIYTAMIWLAPSGSTVLVFAAFIITGISEMSDNVGYTNMCLFCCPSEDKSTYVAVTNVGVIPFMVILPIAMGWLIDRGILSYGNMFALAMGMMIAAIVYILAVVRNPQGYTDMKAAAADTRK
ncbi:MFS transporter [bacterium]|nr:MFS transporter [bacterium]